MRDVRTQNAALAAKTVLSLLKGSRRTLWLSSEAVRDLKRLAKETPELRSATQWLKTEHFEGITVIDPDGWDRKNYAESWAEEISLPEMRQRVSKSSVMMLPKLKGKMG